MPNRSGARALRGAGASGSSAACPSRHLSATSRASPISAAAQSLSCASTGESPSSVSHQSGYSPPRFVLVNGLPPDPGLSVAQILPDGFWQAVLGHDALPLVVIRTENHGLTSALPGDYSTPAGSCSFSLSGSMPGTPRTALVDVQTVTPLGAGPFPPSRLRPRTARQRGAFPRQP